MFVLIRLEIEMNEKNENFGVIKSAYIAAGGAIIVALITGIVSTIGKSESKPENPSVSSITQTVSGNGTGVINTGSGSVSVQLKD